MKVSVEIEEVVLQSEEGRDIDGVVARCSRCDHQTGVVWLWREVEKALYMAEMYERQMARAYENEMSQGSESDAASDSQ